MGGVLAHATMGRVWPNDRRQLLGTVGATQERTLEAVGCKPLFGAALPAGRLGDCRVWSWNGVELIVTQPFDPCEGLARQH